MERKEFYEDYPQAVAAVYNDKVDVAFCIVAHPNRLHELHLIKIQNLGGPTPQHTTIGVSVNGADELIDKVGEEL